MSLFRGAAITGGLTLVSRILGFVRDLLIARLFGASPLADAYFVAFRIPNLLRSFVAEGALNSAFVPVFVSKVKEGESQRNSAFSQALGFVSVLSGGITLLGMIFAPQVVSWMAPGFAETGDKLTLTVQLTQIMFPLLLCVSLVAAIGGALNALKIFGAPAAAQISMNLVLILGALAAAYSSNPIFVLSWSVLLGGIAQIITQLPALRRAGLSFSISLKWQKDVIKPILSLLLPATLGAAVYQGTIFLATIFASLVGDGAVSWLFYADRLTQLPIGIFSIALASVLLPALARAKVDGNHVEFNTQLVRSLRWTSFVLIPISVWLWIDAPFLVKILFERGSFTPHDTAMTSGAVRGLTLGLWAMSCQSMVTRAFIASHDTKTPSLLGLLSLIAYVIGALVCTQELRVAVLGAGSAQFASALWATLNLGHIGLSVSSSIAALLSFSISLLIALRRFNRLDLSSFLTSTLTCLSASALSGAAFLFAREYFGELPALLNQSLGVGVLLCVHYVVLFSVKSRELGEIRQVILRKFK